MLYELGKLFIEELMSFLEVVLRLEYREYTKDRSTTLFDGQDVAILGCFRFFKEDPSLIIPRAKQDHVRRMLYSFL
jgi:hypothetical protein